MGEVSRGGVGGGVSGVEEGSKDIFEPEGKTGRALLLCYTSA